MLRRSPMTIELKLEDIQEYEEMRHKVAKEKQQKPFNELPAWPNGPKSKQEVYSRVGYNPPERQPARTNLL